jgi:hypothetical protein
VPSFVDWERILGGALPRDEATEYFTYERVFLDKNTFELRHVTGEEYFMAIGEAATLHKRRAGCAWWLGLGLFVMIVLAFRN